MQGRAKQIGICLLVGLFWACGSSEPPRYDAGAKDSGVADAGHDAGPRDAGLPDAGDAGLPDAGMDAGLPDAGPQCGDGWLAPDEACDDGALVTGDGCSDHCQVEPGFRCAGEPSHCVLRVCGDGTRDPNEACDDGNRLSGDGCSADCALEGVVDEVEPNGSIAEAGQAPIEVTGPAVLRGTITDGADEADLFRVRLAAPTLVRFELFEDDALLGCPTLTSTLRLFTDVGVQLVTDDVSGLGSCSALVFPLPAGTFYVQVEEAGNDGDLHHYALQVAPQASAGMEVEPNDGAPTATPLPGFHDVSIDGHHPNASDSDVFALTVPEGGSLRAELVEGDREHETCESQDVDTRLTLYSPQFVQLDDDDDSGRGFCSLLDGTGDAPKNAGAHALPAGTYYLQVRSSPFASQSSAQFRYRLSVVVR